MTKGAIMAGNASKAAKRAWKNPFGALVTVVIALAVLVAFRDTIIKVVAVIALILFLFWLLASLIRNDFGVKKKKKSP